MFNLAFEAMEELIKMAQTGEPLWITSLDGSGPALNEDEYVKAFPNRIGSEPNALIKREASRGNTVVMMKRNSLVEILMDVNQWSTVFVSMVSNPLTLEIISKGEEEESYNGALQVMTAEYQVPTPFVPTRESYFLRYCKKHEDGTWAVVDVSLESPISRCHRRPSGCLIQEMTSGYSKVTWVEHVEVQELDEGVDDLYKQLLSSGHVFVAKHWVATLDRHSERLASILMTTNINLPDSDVSAMTSEDGRKGMLKLAERMMASFCTGVCSISTSQCLVIDNVRVTVQKSTVDDPGKPSGLVLCAATFFHIPVTPKRVYDFLRDKNSRSEWDILSNGASVEEMARIATGRGTGNGVSLLRLDHSNSSQTNILVLEETCSDRTSSFIVYAPVDMAEMKTVRDGGDPYKMPLLPSGFAIFSDGSSGGSDGGGSLITIGFQILVSSLVSSGECHFNSIANINNLIESTIEKIFEGFHVKRG
ncbi:homeobox-leucine zipper protein MERISTEM L1-like [Tripterygium wilfordii]|uniref:homeobox-leucine zipper protein MERISTEM L1-like n=1 Tax=Tripterygium wilfordii TaxID=458696 RepID=UPI0018F82B28|nr:homeobox-leucine zipper protein MERISTEM L1-like [Tripterygium wilfordii]